MIVILGFNKTGKSVYNYLQKINKKPIVINNIDDADPLILEKSEIIIKSPGIPLSHPLLINFLDKIRSEFYFWEKKSNTIAITGTNGKSTVADRIYHILKNSNISCCIGGNFGTPVLDLPSIDKNGWNILELSSFQLEMKPDIDLDIACLLDIYPNHIDHHGSIENYILSKKNIFNKAKHAMLTKDYDIKIPKNIIGNLENGWLYNDGSKVLDLSNLKKHEQKNCALVYSVCKKIGLSDEIIARNIKNYKGLPHRQESILKIGNVEFINDSKATNMQALLSCISNFKNIYLIMGGKINNSQDNIKELRDSEFFNNIKKIYGIGEVSDFLKFDNYISCYTLNNAMSKIFQTLDLNSDSTIILSPGFSSLDQYENYEKRGEHFKRLIEKYFANHNKSICS